MAEIARQLRERGVAAGRRMHVVVRLVETKKPGHGRPGPGNEDEKQEAVGGHDGQ